MCLSVLSISCMMLLVSATGTSPTAVWVSDVAGQLEDNTQLYRRFVCVPSQGQNSYLHTHSDCMAKFQWQSILIRCFMSCSLRHSGDYDFWDIVNGHSSSWMASRLRIHSWLYETFEQGKQRHPKAEGGENSGQEMIRQLCHSLYLLLQSTDDFHVCREEVVWFSFLYNFTQNLWRDKWQIPYTSAHS